MLRLRKTDGAAHQPLDPRPQGDVLALDSLHVFLPNDVLLRVHMTLIGPPAVCVVSSDTKRLQQGLQAEKNLVLTPTEHRGQDLPCVMVDGVPEPAWIRFLAGSALHVMLAKQFRATVDPKRFPRQRRSTARDGHQRSVSTVSVSQVQEKWPHP